LIRLGENALFHLPVSGVVVRIARTMNYWPDVLNEVNVARWLALVGFPAGEVCDLSQPIECDGHPVTFWRFVDGRPGARQDIATLGCVLRRLHELPRPTSFDLPKEDILGRVQSRIDGSSVPRDDKRFLSGRLEALRSALSSLSYPLPAAPTHGDAHSET